MYLKETTNVPSNTPTSSTDKASEGGDADDVERRRNLAEIYLAVLGHDLRNPLSAIKMGAQMLSSSAMSSDAERTLKIATRIANSADRMVAMIEQVSDFTRSQLGSGFEINSSTFDLNETLQEVSDELKAGQGRDIRVEKHGESLGEWDRKRLTQAFKILVANAVTYGDPNHPVIVSVTGVQGEVLVNVWNAGAIAPEALSQLLVPRRRPSLSSGQGLGLGLYIADAIVRQHLGTLTVESTAKDGTTARVKLPRRV